MRAFIFIVLLFGLVLADQEQNCPKVFDGLTNGHFDISTQFSNNTMSANWVGLNNDEILSYDCAVVSESLFKVERLSDSCRLVPGFLGIPDIKHWINVRKENSITINNLKLVPDTKYYVVLRTTLKTGVQVYSNSDGVTVLPRELILEGSGKARDHGSNIPNLRGCPEIINQPVCPIDEDNRIRAAQISVQDFLNEFYGPPVYIDDRLLFVLPVVVVPDDEDDDDDSAANHGKIGGVVGGVLLLMLLCLCLLALLALLMNRKGSDDPFGERIIENKREHVDADIGTSVEHTIGSDTRVEFPDIDPHSRLSQA